MNFAVGDASNRTSTAFKLASLPAVQSSTRPKQITAQASSPSTKPSLSAFNTYTGNPASMYSHSQTAQPQDIGHIANSSLPAMIKSHADASPRSKRKMGMLSENGDYEQEKHQTQRAAANIPIASGSSDINSTHQLKDEPNIPRPVKKLKGEQGAAPGQEEAQDGELRTSSQIDAPSKLTAGSSSPSRDVASGAVPGHVKPPGSPSKSRAAQISTSEQEGSGEDKEKSGTIN
jgi:hypothetical protein